MTNPTLVEVADAWRASHPGAAFGLIAFRNVANPPAHEGLHAVASELEDELRSRFGDADRETLSETPPLPAYAAYYKRWGQRYHVAMQLASVAQKDKSLPRVAALVEAMFIAELRNLMLTAGHDLDQLALPLRLAAGNDESFVAPNGKELTVKPGDMFTADAQGRVLSAIVTGPSDVARISPSTTAAVFYTYAPTGIGPTTVAAHLDDIERNVRLVSPDAEVLGLEIVTA